MEYYSQIGQDKFVDDFFNQKENLVFLDIGAHDGVDLSNSLFFEKYRNWTGLCIEPQLTEFTKLQQNRKCPCLNIAVSNFDGETDFTYVEGPQNVLSGIPKTFNPMHSLRIKLDVARDGGAIHNTRVPVRRLQSILDEHSLLNIDYCSLDTEGSEFDIIQSIDFNKTDIKIFTVENNYRETTIQNFLESKGYSLFTKLQWDDVFIKKSLI